MADEGDQTSLRFVMVHGAGHGGWCWFKIRSLLESSGHKVTCVDLKASGIHPADPTSVVSFQDSITLSSTSSPPCRKTNRSVMILVILVGHSAGGLSLTDAIRRFPHRLHSAIYVAGNMSKHGLSTDEAMKDGKPDLAKYGDVVKEVEQAVGPENPPTSVVYKKEFQRKLLYQMSPAEDSTLASMLLRPAPAMAFKDAKFDGAAEEDDGVRRVYVKTKRDRVVSEEKQDDMIRKWPPSQVYELDSGHSPFFSAPFDLYRILVDAAARPSSAMENAEKLG